MKKNMKNLVVTSLSAAMLVAAGVGVATVPAQAEVSTTTTVARLTGAAARIATESNPGSGLRFFAKIDRTAYEEAAAAGEVEVGMIIVPTEYVAAGNDTHAELEAAYGAAGTGYIDVSYTEEQVANYSVYAASITNLKDKNYVRDFTAIAYISVDGEYSYAVEDASGADYSRSIYQVATKAYAAGKESSDTLAVLKGYMDGVIDVTYENGELAIANNTLTYTSPFTVAEEADGWLIEGESVAKSMLYNGERKTNFNVTTENDEEVIVRSVKGGTIEGDTVSLATTKEAGSYSTQVNATDKNFVAYHGEYGVGTYIDVTYSGKNFPKVMFFADNVNGNMTSAGGKGVTLFSWFASKNDARKAFPYGPNRVPYDSTIVTDGPQGDGTYVWDNHIDYSYKYFEGAALIGYGSDLNTPGAYPLLTPLGAARDESGDTYKLRIGTYLDGGIVYMEINLYNVTDGVQVYALSRNTKLTEAQVGTGSIIVYETGMNDIGDLAWTDTATFTVSRPYASEPTLFTKGATFGADGVTLDGVRPIHAGYGSGLGSPSGTEDSYIAFKGEYGVGNYLSFTYTGNNMPYVMFFADAIDGFIGGSRTTDKGLVIMNGIVEAGNTTNVANSVDTLKWDALTVWGPNRYKGTRGETETALVKTTQYPALMQSGLNSDEYKNTNFKYVVGTFINSIDNVVYVDITLYNLDASATEPMYEVTFNTGLTEDQLPAGNIVVAAPMKGHDGSEVNTAGLDSTFKYTEPYFVAKTKAVPVIYKGAENADGSVTLQGVKSVGNGWSSGIASTDNSYVGIVGDYGVGTFIDITFKGANMPHVVLLADTINGCLATGKSSTGTATNNVNHGYVLANGMDYGTSLKYGHDTLAMVGPHRFHDAMALCDNWAVSKGSAFGWDAMVAASQDIEYKYTVGTMETDGGMVMIIAELYNNTTGELLASARKLAVVHDGSNFVDATREEVEAVCGTNILLAGSMKNDASGNAIPLTFSYSEPYKVTEKTYAAEEGVTENADGTVTLATGWGKVEGTMASVGAGTGAGYYRNSYVAMDNACEVGSYVQANFTGNNMPQVMLFANATDPYMGNDSAYRLMEQKGFLITNGLYSVHTTTEIWADFLYVHANGITENLAYIEGTNLTFTNDTAYAALEDGKEYAYVVGSKLDGENNVVIEAALYEEGDTGFTLVWSAEYATGMTEADVEALGDTVIFYAGVKGAGVTTTFSYEAIDTNAPVKKNS